MAQQSTLGDVVLNLQARDISATRGLESIENALSSAQSKLLDFSNISKIVFGFNISSKAFNLIHDGLLDFASGSHEAMRAGLGFWDSLEVGVQKMFGAKTALDELKEKAEATAKAYQELEQRTRAAIDAAAQSRGGATSNASSKSFRAAIGDKGEGGLFESVNDPAAVDAALKENVAQTVELGNKYTELAKKKRELDAIPIVERTAEWGKLHNDLTNEMRRTKDAIDAMGKAYGNMATEAAHANQRARELVEFMMGAELEGSRVDARFDAAFQDMERQNANQAFNDERDALATKIKEGLDPLSEFTKKAMEIEELLGEGRLTRDEADAAQDKLLEQFKEPEQKQRGPEFVGLEEMARRIQMGANPQLEEAKKQTGLLEKANTRLQEIRDKESVASFG